jgi:ParB/RepB/Spo0J family partition protein
MQNSEHDNELASQNQNVPEPPVATLGAGPGETREIPIREIAIGDCCRRRSYEDLDGLVTSIKKSGLVNPVTVNADADGHLTLLCGSRRLKAHEQLGRETITCRIVHLTPAQAAILSISENVHREDVHPVELARQIQSAMEASGSNQTDIAEGIGLTQPAVSSLLGILALDKDIIEQIGIGSESPFKRTHAEILGELMRSKRATRKVEVRQLLNKTINQSLGTKELKSLVQFFTTGGYGRLPERLRTSLLEDKGMTSQMAMLYLEPGKVVEGEGAVALQWRQAAERLDKQWLAQQIVKAAKANWPFAKTKQTLLDVIQEQLHGKAKGTAEPKSSGRKLIDDISTLRDQLDICGNEVSGWAQSDRWRLETVCCEIQNLQSHLSDFLGTAAKAREATTIEPSTAERGVYHDSIA